MIDFMEGFRTRSNGLFHVEGTGKTINAWAVKDRSSETVQEFTDIVHAITYANRLNVVNPQAALLVGEVVDSVCARQVAR